jgi:branched-chain amino acid transport system ATP-binding protein
MLLELHDVQVFYGRIQAIKSLSFTVGDGEVVTLIGANGAGKTTTLKAISGVRPVAAGRIIFDGRDITHLAPHKRVELGICQAPEGRGIFPGMSVLENLEMGCYTRRERSGATKQQDLDRVFTLFPRLAERRPQMGGTLSGGEQQMLAIGRALMARPRLLLLDEPSMGLAPMLIAQIFTIITEINEQGTTILLVEQNAAQALARAHRAYVLETGRIVKEGGGGELLDDEAVQAAYLGGDVGTGMKVDELES